MSVDREDEQRATQQPGRGDVDVDADTLIVDLGELRIGRLVFGRGRLQDGDGHTIGYIGPGDLFGFDRQETRTTPCSCSVITTAPSRIEWVSAKTAEGSTLDQAFAARFRETAALVEGQSLVARARMPLHVRCMRAHWSEDDRLSSRLYATDREWADILEVSPGLVARELKPVLRALRAAENCLRLLLPSQRHNPPSGPAGS